METKKTYIAPQIELVELDNEISLALESNPPIYPGEGLNSNENNPFKPEINLT